MRILSLALLLSIAGKSATVIPVVAASTPTLPVITDGYSQMAEQTGSFIVGPGGAVVDYNITLSTGSNNVTSMGGQFPTVSGESSVDVLIPAPFQLLLFSDLSFPAANIDTNVSPCFEQLLCSTSFNNVSLAPGIYRTAVSIDQFVDVHNAINPQGTVFGSFASFSLTVLSGDVAVTPEPGTWALCGLGLLLLGGAVQVKRNLAVRKTPAA